MTIRYLALILAIAAGSWLVSSLLSVCTPRGYRVVLRVLLAIAAACFLAALVAGCQAPPVPAVAAPEQTDYRQADAHALCLVEVMAVGLYVGDMEAQGFTMRLPDRYPDTLYLRCMLHRGKVI